MTPAILTARRAGIRFDVLEYGHDPAATSYGLEAAEKLQLPPEQVFKTLVIQLDGSELLVALVPVQHQLDLKALARQAGGKKAQMADAALVERTTGYVLGGVSPLGQKKPLRTLIDSSASDFAQIYVSAGRRGLELQLAPADLAACCRAVFVPLAR
ncbi:Cys-tRNA(Pro) deacylase [Rheinheimera sp.]|uniref:Cys-tRNA(Pro)/Cys-tRNA(Cys) deacylase n=1 Tax=Rheinheimera marina TaxID=1774958 RepID=A0ABV9JIS0_9GAMM